MTVTLKYNPGLIPEDVTEEDLVILHDGEPIETVIDDEAKTLEGRIDHFSTVAGVFRKAAQATLVFQSMDPPETETIVLQPGERFDVTFYLKNTSGIDAVDYRLYESESAYSDSETGYPKFTILPGETQGAQVIGLPAPNDPGDYRVWFRIYDTDGVPLPVLSQGTVYVDFTVEAPTGLDQPVLNTPSDGASINPASLSFDWLDVNLATSYRIFIDASQSMLSELSGVEEVCPDCLFSEGSFAESAFTVPDGVLTEGETYYWRIKAWAGNIGASYSDIWQFTVTDSCDLQATLVYQGMAQDVPADVAPGEPVSVSFILENTGGVDAGDYVLAEYGTAYGGGQAVYPAFSINSGGTGNAVVENFPAPEEPVRVYFDIVDGCGNALPALAGGRLYIDFDGSAFCPEIESVDIWQSGAGSALVTVQLAAGSTADGLQIRVDDAIYDLTETETDQYSAMITYAGNKAHTYEILLSSAVCDTGTFPVLDVPDTDSVAQGEYCFKGPCSGFCGTEGDPANTRNGNFFLKNIDGVIKGRGRTHIKLKRIYNSQAAQWPSASVVRFTPGNGDSPDMEIVSGPPQYFGKGWTFPYGTYILAVDKAPVYEGLQVFYADGHTAEFKKDADGLYRSESPMNKDVIVKKDGGYELRKNHCHGCPSDTRHFDAQGRLARISDRNDHSITLTYDGDCLSRIENDTGRYIRFTCNENAQIVAADILDEIHLEYRYAEELLTGFVDGRNNLTQYQYDGNDQLINIISPNGYPKLQMEYDPVTGRTWKQTTGASASYTFESFDDGKMIKITDAYGNVTIHYYDDRGRLVRVVHPDGTEERFEYDEAYNRTLYVDQNGSEWEYHYNDDGLLTSVTGPLGFGKIIEYNEMNQVAKISENIDGMTSRITTFNYDERGNLVEYCDPLGECAHIAYDENGQPSEITDLNGNRFSLNIDEKGNMMTLTDAESAISGYGYDELGRIVEMIKPLGSRYRYRYDANNNLIGVDGPEGYHVGFSFDANNNLIQIIDPNGGEINMEYNLSDELTRLINQEGYDTTAYEYGRMGEITSYADAEGRKWHFGRDEMLRISDAEGPMGTHFSFDYNNVGQLSAITDANGRVDTSEYDELYRPTTVVRNYQEGAPRSSDTNVTTEYEYNCVNDLLKIIDPEGNVTEFFYDMAGRRTGRLDAQGNEWHYTYDSMSNLTGIVNPRGYVTEFEYSDAYLLSKMINPENHVTTYTHDANRNLTDVTDPRNVTTHYEYNELGRITKKILNFNPAAPGDESTNIFFEYGYDNAGNLTSITNPRGYTTVMDYDGVHRKTAITDPEGGVTYFNYDKVDNLAAITDANGNAIRYGYDDLDRLTEATNAEGETIRYEYDAMGNRTKIIEADQTQTKFGYDMIYRLNEVTQNYRDGESPDNDTNVTTRYEYDARGLLTGVINANGAVTNFFYDKISQLIKEIDPLGNTWTYEYDGMGNRTRRIDANNAVTEYDYYPDDRLEEIRYLSDITWSVK